MGVLGSRDYTDKIAYAESVPINPDLVTNLKRQLEFHSGEMHKIQEMLTLLERNPDFEKMINLSRGLL